MDSREIFDGLEIAKDTYLCEKWRNKYPTIFLSFKDVDGLTFSSAYDMLSVTITELYKEHLYLLESERISVYDKEIISGSRRRKRQRQTSEKTSISKSWCSGY